MVHASLFSGIGGFDLAAKWKGYTNLFQCEIDSFCRDFLAHHYPDTKRYEDVKTFNASIHAGRVDILTGGFPCQPYSAAGLRKGKEDERHLWPEMLRIIREVQPRWIVGENVYGLLNWSEGLVFEEVQAELEAEGYKQLPVILPAAGINAPHKRNRIFFIAYNQNNRQQEAKSANRWREQKSQNRTEVRDTSSTDGGGRTTTKPNSLRLSQSMADRELEGDERSTQRDKFEAWDSFPSFSPICGGDDGISRELFNIPFPQWRKEIIKALGNAIVPQLAYHIFTAIEETEKKLQDERA
jgi:DNA (cytosine-5)-methyltransferase 1